MGELEPILAGINAAVHELVELVDVLRDLLPERGGAGDNPTSRRPPGTRPPWDSLAANAYLSIHAWVREAEADLGTYVHGNYWRRASGSDGATKNALEFIAVYCEDARVPEPEVRRIARHLGTLLRAAQSVPGIDLAPPPAASLTKPCPECGEGTLVAGADFALTCANQACAHTWTKAQWPALLARLTRGIG